LNDGQKSIIPDLSIDQNAIDYECMLLLKGFYLAICGNGFGVDVDYTIVKDFCRKHGLDSIEVLAVYKEAITKLNDRK